MVFNDRFRELLDDLVEAMDFDLVITVIDGRLIDVSIKKIKEHDNEKA